MDDGTRPLMLGLVGDSASGKTTLVRGVVRLLGHNGVTPVCLDDYHRFSRADLKSRGLTAADPDANDLPLMSEHLATLRAGGSISKPVYDHRTGTLRGPEVVAATGLVVAYGMLTLTPPSLASLFDLTVYLEPDEALRQAWRLERDVRERGYTPDEFHARQPGRERDAARFILVQRPLADVVARFHAAPGAARGDLDIELLLRTGEGPDPLEATLDGVAAALPPGLSVTRGVCDEDGRRSDRVLIRSSISSEAAEQIAAQVGRDTPTLGTVRLAALGQIRSQGALRHSLSLALAQLLIVRRLISAQSPDL